MSLGPWIRIPPNQLYPAVLPKVQESWGSTTGFGRLQRVHLGAVGIVNVRLEDGRIGNTPECFTLYTFNVEVGVERYQFWSCKKMKLQPS